MSLRVAAFVAGPADPSARFRVLQHAGTLERFGVSVKPFIPLFSSFPPRARILRPAWGAAVLAERLAMTAATRRYELTLFQKTMVSTLPTFEGRCGSPRVLDVDDPIYVHRGGWAARRVAGSCDLVICGNPHLAERFARWNPRVVVIPTAVDTERWKPPEGGASAPLRVGWIGSSCNLRYIEEREAALRAFLEACPAWSLRFVCDRAPRLPSLPASRVSFSPWSAATEVEEVTAFSIGIMPLADGETERGKCAFKMLQYMACGVPVVVSPVGMNAEVLSRGPCGLGPADDAGWTEALVSLARDEAARRRMGEAGRRVVEDRYSAAVVVPLLAAALLSARAS